MAVRLHDGDEVPAPRRCRSRLSRSRLKADDFRHASARIRAGVARAAAARHERRARLVAEPGDGRDLSRVGGQDDDVRRVPPVQGVGAVAPA